MTENREKTDIGKELFNKLVKQSSESNEIEEINRELADPDIRAALINEIFSDLMEGFKEKLQDESKYLALQEVISLRTVLTEETDRGCALMAAAYLDGELEKLIKAKLVNNERVIKDLFSHNGSLGSFSARIDFAYLLGLISHTTRTNLHLLRKIRNEFAHIASRISFNTNLISSRCNELKGLGLSKTSKPRAKFIRSMMNASAEIHGSLFKTSHIEEQQEFNKETSEKLENELDIFYSLFSSNTSNTSTKNEEY